MPPQLLSPDFTVPSTVRSLTSPLRYPKNPARPEALSTLRSLIVCPLPSNVPVYALLLVVPTGDHLYTVLPRAASTESFILISAISFADELRAALLSNHISSSAVYIR